MKSPFPLSLVIIAALAVSACKSGSSTPTSPTPSAPFSTTDVRVGTGAEATNGRTISVTYTGWLYNPAGPDGKGQQFDSNGGGAPFSFVLGTGNVIQGWHRGVVGMRVGGLRRIVIPPDLAYGTRANGPIPANSTLVFDVEVLAVQ